MNRPNDSLGVRATPKIVAIDGPAGVGKSTVARRLAAALDVPYIDTGAMYRAAALHFRERGIDVDDRTAVAAALTSMPLELVLRAGGAQVTLGGVEPGERLRQPEVSALTSRIAVHPEVRRRLVELQQAFAAAHGGVMEGRDIGTVVAPETPYKFYLDAAPSVRAARRHAELEGRGASVEVSVVAREMEERDRRDQSRAESPLQAAADACPIDTGGLTPDGVVAAMLAEIDRRSSRR